MKIATIYHVFGFIWNVMSLVMYRIYVSPTRQLSFGGPWKFLTFINMTLQMLLFTFCVIVDISYYLGHKKFAAKLSNIRGYFLASIAFPVTLLVFTTFWSIFLVDRELVYPARFDQLIPVFYNHIMHSSILLGVFEVAMSKHKYPSRIYGMLGSWSFGVLYLCWIFVIHAYTGIWIYPIIAVLSTTYFCLFVAVLLLFLSGLYVMGEYCNKLTGSFQESVKNKES